MRELEVGDPLRLGDHELVGVLGTGGFGRVYVARAPHDKWLTVKLAHPHLLRADARFADRFERVMGDLSRVRNLGAGRIVQWDSEDVRPWYARRFVPGASLTELVAAFGALPRAAGRIVGGVARCLAAMHAAELPHGGVSPGNVLVSANAAQLVDGGLVRLFDRSTPTTRRRFPLAGPTFVAPEDDPETTSADLYALGVLLVLCVRGTLPAAPGDTAELPEDLAALAQALMDPVPLARPRAAEVAAWIGGPGGERGAVSAGIHVRGRVVLPSRERIGEQTKHLGSLLPRDARELIAWHARAADHAGSAAGLGPLARMGEDGSTAVAGLAGRAVVPGARQGEAPVDARAAHAGSVRQAGAARGAAASAGGAPPPLAERGADGQAGTGPAATGETLRCRGTATTEAAAAAATVRDATDAPATATPAGSPAEGATPGTPADGAAAGTPADARTAATDPDATGFGGAAPGFAAGAGAPDGADARDRTSASGPGVRGGAGASGREADASVSGGGVRSGARASGRGAGTASGAGPRDGTPVPGPGRRPATPASGPDAPRAPDGGSDDAVVQPLSGRLSDAASPVAASSGARAAELPARSLWIHRIPGVQSLFAADGLLFADGDNLTALDALSGDPVWSKPGWRMAGEPRDGRAYLAQGTRIALVDAATGTEVWRTDIAAARGLWARSAGRLARAERSFRVHAVCEPVPGVVTAIGGHSELFGLDPATGALLWNRREARRTAFSRDGAGAIFLSGDGREPVHALDAATGELLWRDDAEDSIVTAVDRGWVLCARFRKGTAEIGEYVVRAAQSGQLLHRDPNPGDMALLDDCVLYVLGGGRLRAVCPVEGKTLWDVAWAGGTVGMAFAPSGESAFLRGEDRRIYAFDIADGRRRWVSEPIPARPPLDPVGGQLDRTLPVLAAGDVVCVRSHSDAVLIVLDREDGRERWWWRAAFGTLTMVAPVVVGEFVYVVDGDRVRALTARR
ncbi:PQQ-binding-like beta-propeller repeat protein [Yinghuangia sp. ASG 101]|uniref:outer membrane protein assembly factor BamB family protein n=1 Tax=Yinghuangia sp. ASG 101 TaxID=2896848 RepID=UPI001E550337|nr:PQQ-binding-like beta-propeller repeat protein [Yinghuangia sp. ASG 101]UGQ14001.1 PQQ-binding-like beta-propeller repeat protein [Yinghuangia sp. ASG 101]